MLVALTDQNERLVLQTSIPKDKLRQLRNEREFYCPQCKNNVHLKIGAIKIPHFAHKTKSACEAFFSEGESEQHLLGKEHLYQLFLQLGYEVELESYIRNLKQRPDLLVKTKDGKLFAIEFQCSNISKEYLQARNSGYQLENIQSIWIPNTPQRLNLSAGMMIVSLSEQFQQFVLSTKNQRYILSYNPHKKQFIYFTNLLHIKDNQYLCKVQKMPLEQQMFPFYLPKKLTRNEFLYYFKTYLDSKVRFLNNRVLISRKGVNDLFLRSVYELRLSFSSIPTFIGVPIKGNESLKVFAVEWQAALFYFAHFNRVEISNLDRQVIEYFLKWAKLDISEDSILIISDYINLLKQLNIQHIYSSVENDKLLESLYMQFLA